MIRKSRNPRSVKTPRDDTATLHKSFITAMLVAASVHTSLRTRSHTVSPARSPGRTGAAPQGQSKTWGGASTSTCHLPRTISN
ncbi:unnamed protein product [Phytophthora fragariaefolia]|uniref:Unnamed protein product n=1 Tax=Phytophthora fragariaefolia TaxID=1490495 RepID=A0A9W6X132_9STRA|nr:unnamed protein product [Phytophthora fragariaefolia]